MNENTLMLLQICDLAKQWPNLKSIHDLAMQDLMAQADEAQDEINKRAEEAAKKVADAKAKADAEAKAIADKEAKAQAALAPKPKEVVA